MAEVATFARERGVTTIFFESLVDPKIARTVAAEIGYGSEAAFSRAFKKMVGMPPSAWRRRPGLAGSRP